MHSTVCLHTAPCLKELRLLLTHQVNLAFVHHDPDTHKKCKHQLVLLKEAAAHIAVEAEGEVLVDICYPLLQCV